jgi:hypothetical protein
MRSYDGPTQPYIAKLSIPKRAIIFSILYWREGATTKSGENRKTIYTHIHSIKPVDKILSIP